jgi:hypothetical protein
MNIRHNGICKGRKVAVRPKSAQDADDHASTG